MALHSDDPHLVRVGDAPTPFTADEIRRGCPVGKVIRVRLEPAGQPPVLRTNRFLGCDDEGATIERRTVTERGEQVGEVLLERSTWRELQEHASFPADKTEIQTERIRTPIGDLDCWRYTVTDGHEVDTFWFAMALPGMPIKFQSSVAGNLTSTSTVVAREMPDTPEPGP